MTSPHFEPMGSIRDLLDFMQPVSVRPLGGDRKCCRVVRWLVRTEVLAVAGDDGFIRIYNITGEETKVVETRHRRIYGMTEMDRNVIVTCGQDGNLCAWNISRDPRILDVIAVPDNRACTKMFSPNKTRVFIGTETGGFLAFSWDNGRFDSIRAVPYAHGSRIECIHGHGDYVATASKDQTVAIWSMTLAERMVDLYFQDRVFSVRFSRQHMAVGSVNYVRLYLGKDPFTHITDIQVQCGVLWCLSFVSNDLLMACGEIALNFARTSGKYDIVGRVETSAKIVQDAVFLPNGDVAVVGTGKTANSIIRLPSQISKMVIKEMDRFRNESTLQDTLSLDKSELKSIEHSNRNTTQPVTSNSLESQSEHDRTSFPKENGADIERSSSTSCTQENYNKSELSVSDDLYTINAEDLHEEKAFYVGLLRPRNDSKQIDTRAEVDDSAEANEEVEKGVQLKLNSEPASSEEEDVIRQDDVVIATKSDPEENRKSNIDVVYNQVPHTSTKPNSVFSLVPSMVIMKRCEKTEITTEGLLKLDTEDLSNVLASFMLRYNIEWLNMFQPLKLCVRRFLDDQLLIAADLIGECAVDQKTLVEGMEKALEQDADVGARLGPIICFKRFLKYFRADGQFDLHDDD